MAREADVARKVTWRAGSAQMQRGTEATWQGRAWPTRGTGGAGGADTWQEAMRVHADAREGRHVASGEVSSWRAHVLVGPGYRIGAVIHLRYDAPAYILANFAYFLGVGLCSCEVSSLQDTWRCRGRWMQP